MKPQIDSNAKTTVIEHDSLKIVIEDDHVTIDTDKKVFLKGRTLKKFASSPGASVNEVLFKLQE